MITRSTDRFKDSLAQDKLVDILAKLGLHSTGLWKLHRALTVGQPLVVEDLDAVLKTVTFDESVLKLWPNVKPGIKEP